jgi:hypothetical protein
MKTLRQLARRIRLLLGRRAFERDLEDEMRFHVEMQAAKHVERGIAPDEARSMAAREFGMITRHKEEVRDARGLTWADDLGRDVRFSLRTLRRAPGFVAVALLCLGLGIGANAAIFSVVNAVLLKPLPYPEPERLVELHETFKFGGGQEAWGAVSWPNFVDWREQATGFEQLAGYAWGNVSLRGAERPERLNAVSGTANLFTLLGVRPMLGRTYAPGEDQPGHERVAVLSEPLWRQAFGADSSLVGAGLLMRGFLTLRSVEPGLDTRNVLTMHVAIPGDRFAPNGPAEPFLRPAMERLRAGCRTSPS